MAEISAFSNIPDISFIDDKTIDDVKDELVADYEDAYESVTGTAISLSASSPMRLALYAAAAQIYQAMQYIDRAGKQNLLKYSYGDYLKNVGILKNITENDPAAATTTLRFTLSAVQASAVGIPAGTRATNAAGSAYFATTEYVEITAGETYVDVTARCTETGTAGNGLAIGSVVVIVDPVAYVGNVTNTTNSAGGTDEESDEDLTERIYLAPSSYSTAGPEAAYVYWVKSYSNDIGDVKVLGDAEGGTVYIYFLMEDGSTPETEVISGVQAFFDEGDVRPLTDLVVVAAPTEVSYTIELAYYINQSDSAQAVAIQSAVLGAVDDYVTWQRKIGRDINPSKLAALVMTAGAKRVTVTLPTQTAIDNAEVSVLGETATITYEGLEDD